MKNDGPNGAKLGDHTQPNPDDHGDALPEPQSDGESGADHVHLLADQVSPACYRRPLTRPDINLHGGIAVNEADMFALRLVTWNVNYRADTTNLLALKPIP